MTAATLLVLAVGTTLAFANGSNDVSKGIATLVGSGVTDYRRALAWGTVWTAVGGLLGAVLAGAMLTTFGKGLLSSGTTPTFAGALAALVGAAGWVLLATRTGLPVSTTHAIVGSLVGVASLAYGVGSVRWGALGVKVLLPLLASPLAGLLITAIVLGATRAGGEARAARPTLDHLHWLTSGATSLARGMNDGPKMVALVAAASVLIGGARISTPAAFALTTAAMVAGSLVAGRRVTTVLAVKVTAMDHREGFAANLVTAGLVTAGAIYGLPMSTTHVSSAGIFGTGALRGSLDRKTLQGILLAWVVTLPAAAAIGMAAYELIRLVGASSPYS